MNTTHPKIDPEFRNLLEPLPDDCLALLEKSILADGCRDKMIVWDGLLLDGHNRLAICIKHGLGYQTRDIELPDRTAALDWIDANQLGRRNITREHASLVRGRLYNRRKGDPAANLVQTKTDDTENNSAETGAKPQSSPKAQNAPSVGNTAEQIAAKSGVSAGTVKRDGQFVEARDALLAVFPDLKGQSFKKGNVLAAAKVLVNDPDKALEILTGKTPKPAPVPGAKDKLGQPIDGDIAEAFARAGEITTLMGLTSKIKAALTAAKKDGDPLFIALNFNAIGADLENVRGQLSAVVPYARCPYCAGDGCKACHNRGWVGKFVYRAAPEEMKP